jgi:hypothetical protein
MSETDIASTVQHYANSKIRLMPGSLSSTGFCGYVLSAETVYPCTTVDRQAGA